ncbi:MAG: T9SS type A sorting domain-containing protein [Flavobacteriales bacterium]|nr:T9SS type A sorting domain-containing protein [Flavobacteriales bacterium]
MKLPLRVLDWLLLVPSIALAQVGVPPTGTYYDDVRKQELRLELLKATLSDEEFHAEGGAYSEHQKYVRMWDPYLGHSGEYSFYEAALKHYADRNNGVGSTYKSNSDPWQELGPRRRGNHASRDGIGPIEFISILESDPSTMLCGSMNGGLFITYDEAENWQNAGTDLGWTRSGCKDATFYPSNTEGVDERVTWFALSAGLAGDDKLVTNSARIGEVSGVERTLDGGVTWSLIGNYLDFGGPGTALGVIHFDRKVNTLGQHRLFVGTSNGLYFTDEPLNDDPIWHLVQMPTAPSSITNVYPSFQTDRTGCGDITYLPPTTDQENENILCATIRYIDENNANTPTIAVWRFMISTDNGATWIEIPGQPSPLSTDYSYTVETTKASPNEFYLNFQRSIASASLIQSYDVVNEQYTTRAAGFNSIFGTGHGFGIDQHNAASFMVSHGTANGGTSAKWFRPDGGTNNIVENGHDDVEDIVGHPDNPGEFWIANHGGVSVVNINGTTTSWSDRSDGLGVAEVEALATSQNIPDFLVTGLYHDGSKITRTLYPENGYPWDPDWEYLSWGDGTRCLVDHKDPDHVYTSHQVSYWFLFNNATSSAQYTNQYVPSPWFPEGDLNRGEPSTVYRTEIVIVPSEWDPNGDGIPTTFNNKEVEVNRSFDRGTTRQIISNFVSNPDLYRLAQGNSNHDNERIDQIVSSPADPDHLYVAFKDFDYRVRLFRTTMANHPDPEVVKASWHEVPIPRRYRDGPLTGIEFDPHNENIVFLSYGSSTADFGPDFGSEMVYRMDYTNLSLYPAGSFDCEGLPCADITMNLPLCFTERLNLAFEQGSDEGLYFATEVGVYFTNRTRIAAFTNGLVQSPDDPENTSGWVRVGDGLPHVRPKGLEINYAINQLRVGTFGRGVWQHALRCPDLESQHETGSYSEDGFIEMQTAITADAQVSTPRSVTYRAGETVRLLPGFHAGSGSRFHAFIHPCDRSGNSFTPKARLNASVSDEHESTSPANNLATLAAFPNPSSGNFALQIVGPEKYTQGMHVVEVLDALGNKVAQHAFSGASTTLGFVLPVGVYLVREVANHRIRPVRLIIE